MGTFFGNTVIDMRHTIPCNLKAIPAPNGYSGIRYRSALFGAWAETTLTVVSNSKSGPSARRRCGSYASYIPRTWPCSCRAPYCSGRKRNDMWEQAISYLAQVAAAEALSGCISNNRLRVAIVKRIFGDKTLTLEQMAEKNGVGERTARNHAIAIKRWLLGMRNPKDASEYGLITLSMARAESVLEEAGIIASETES